MIVPSFFTRRTGRLIGIIWLVGSTSERCSEPGLRCDPMSLRFGRHARADAADAMARGAAALAVEDGAAARRVTGLDGCGVERVHVAQIGDDASHLRVVERERRHPRGLRTGPDESREIVIALRVPELAAAQVDAANRIALWTVARDASRRVQS